MKNSQEGCFINTSWMLHGPLNKDSIMNQRDDRPFDSVHEVKSLPFWRRVSLQFIERVYQVEHHLSLNLSQVKSSSLGPGDVQYPSLTILQGYILCLYTVILFAIIYTVVDTVKYVLTYFKPITRPLPITSFCLYFVKDEVVVDRHWSQSVQSISGTRS